MTCEECLKLLQDIGVTAPIDVIEDRLCSVCNKAEREKVK